MICLLILSATMVRAQSNETSERFFLNVGVGGVLIQGNYTPPVYLGIDYMLTPTLSLSGEYTFLSYESIISRQTQYGYMLAMHYHFNKMLRLSPKWDLYAGPVAEFEQTFSTNFGAQDHSSSRWALGMHIGARYFITDRMAINAKIGTGNLGSVGTIGMSVKF